MTAWYCDHGSTLYPTAYMAVPASSASLPQEGDGKASGLGATPAVASATMDFTGVTAAAGAAFAVHGASLTCVASGASTVQFNAGSGSTLAANLATAINAATAVPATTTGGLASPYLKGLVWAVASGAVLSVHTRVASADLNQSANASATLACGSLGNWTSPPATTNFSGGVSGPWSMYFNVATLPAAISATISAAGSYGAWVATLMGSPAGGDVVNVRTGRAAADITLTFASGSGTTVVGRSVGAAGSYLQTLFDDGTIWNDGSSSGVFTLQKTAGAVNIILRCQGYTRLTGKMKTGVDAISGGTVNFKLAHTYAENAANNIIFEVPTTYSLRHTVVERMETYDSGAGTSLNNVIVIQQGSTAINASQPSIFRDCKLGHMVRANAQMVAYTPSFGGAFDVYDTLLAFGGASTYAQAVVQVTSSQTAPIVVRLFRPKFTGGGGGHHGLMRIVSSSSAVSSALYIEDPVSMGQFIASDSAASVCGAWAGGPGGVGAVDTAISQMLVSGQGKREFLVDTPRYIYEWRDAGFPTTGLSTLPDGTLFSIRFGVVPTSIGAGLVHALAPQRGPRHVVSNTLGAGSRTVTMRFLLDTLFGGSSYSAIDSEWWIEGTYVSSVDDSVVRFSTEGAGSALASDAQAWSSLSYTPFAAGSRSYNRYKIALALTNVKANCDVSLRLMCGKQPSTLNEWCILDPSPGLT